MIYETIELEIEYRGACKQAQCDIELSPGYAGLPIFYLTDKYGHNHTFVRGPVAGWNRLGKEPDWPADFLDALYIAFEKEYKRVTK